MPTKNIHSFPNKKCSEHCHAGKNKVLSEGAKGQCSLPVAGAVGLLESQSRQPFQMNAAFWCLRKRMSVKKFGGLAHHVAGKEHSKRLPSTKVSLTARLVQACAATGASWLPSGLLHTLPPRYR